MNVHLQTKGFIADERLTQHVIGKVQTLSSISERIMEVTVLLKSTRSQTQSGKICELRLAIEGNDLVATAASDSFENAVLRALKAARSQLLALKESRRHRVNRAVRASR